MTAGGGRYGRHVFYGVTDMTKFFRDFVADETGAAAAEYVLILAIVGSGIAAAALALGTSIGDAMNRTAVKISSVNAS